jgi:radical SAM superfamily enzyme YgiQ (UPF0313 family)
MKVLLINPRSMSDATFPEKESQYVHPVVWLPYGLLYLASVLENAGHEVLIQDRNTDLRNIKDLLNKFSPEMIGISALTGPCLLDALDISRAAKTYNPHIHVVWGGVHPTLLPSETLYEWSVDFVVQGEGEYTLLDLVNTLGLDASINKVNGISYKKNGEIHYTSPRPVIKNLDELPLPAWHLLDMSRYINKDIRGRRWITMNTSRGCPYRCAFCYNEVFSKQNWRGLSAGRVIEQINYLQSEYGASHVNFLEDNFTVNKKRLVDICEALIKERTDLEWECESRIGSLDKDLLLKMKRSGCMRIGFGVESGSPKILQLLMKDITVTQSIQTFNLCKEVGIYADAYIMCGLPTETTDEFKMTLNLLRKLTYQHCDMMVFRPYPGTKLHDLCVKEGLFVPPNNMEGWAHISDQHSPRFSVGQIPEDILWREIMKNRRANRWKAIKFFLKETSPHLMLTSNFLHRGLITLRKIVIDQLTTLPD